MINIEFDEEEIGNAWNNLVKSLKGYDDVDWYSIFLIKKIVFKNIEKYKKQ